MGTDSFMELLRSDLNGLSLGAPQIYQQIWGEPGGFNSWYKWACKTLALHSSQIEIEVATLVICKAIIEQDRRNLGKQFEDLVYIKGQFTRTGEKLLKAYRNVMIAQICQYAASGVSHNLSMRQPVILKEVL